MGQTVVAKFRLVSITEHEGGSKTVKFETQYDDSIAEDRRFTKATPWGNIEMNIDNPAAMAHFEIGKCYYADFSRAPS